MNDHQVVHQGDEVSGAGVWWLIGNPGDLDRYVVLQVNVSREALPAHRGRAFQKTRQRRALA